MLRARCFLLALKMTVLVSTASVAEDNTSALEQRVVHVVAGLSPPVAVVGEPPMKLADRLRDLEIPGVSIAVIHEGRIDWARGFGTVAVGGAPVQPDTLFQAASISKPVTATAVLALVQAGKLNLDADVNLGLKSWKVPANRYTAESKVTLRKLLSHSAGVTVGGFAGYQQGAPIPTLAETLNGRPPANNAPIIVDIRPGSQFRYSGGGYMIVQQLLIDVTGKPFPQLLDEMVLKPFGMTRSAFTQPLPAELAAAAMTPYRRDWTPVPGGPHTYPELAAAGLWTTPSDLARFALGLVDAWTGRATPVLSQAIASQMMTPGLGSYGLGPVVVGQAPNRSLAHVGVNDGFVNSMIAFENGEGAVVMTNGDRGGQLAAEIIRSIAVEYGWPRGQPKLRERKLADPQALEQFVGDYQLAPQLLIRISREEGRLFAQITGQQRYELFAASPRDFFYSAVDAEVTFEADGASKPSQLVLRQNGVERIAKRVP